MLQIPSFVYKVLLYIAATGSVARLSAQTEMVQQQVAFNDNKNEAAAVPVKKTKQCHRAGKDRKGKKQGVDIEVVER